MPVGRALIATLLAGLLGGVAGLTAARADGGPNVVAREFVLQHWTIEHGLPVNALTQIVQTRDGYLWIATFDGLVRFDGVRFEVFNSSRSSGLPSNRIAELLESADGSLWLMTTQGHLVRYRDGAFATTADEDETSPQVTALIEHQGQVLAGATDGLYRVDGAALRRIEQIPAGTRVLGLSHGSNDSLWLRTSAGVVRFESDDTSLVLRESDHAPARRWFVADSDEEVWLCGRHKRTRLAGVPLAVVEESAGECRVGLDPEGGLWLFDHDGLYRRRDSSWTRIAGPSWRTHRVNRAFARGPRGRIWILHGGSLYRDGEEIFRLGDTSSGLSSILIDHEGSVWLTSSNQGLFVLRDAAVEVLSVNEGLVNRNVYPLHQTEDGTIWIGSIDGISRFRDGVFDNFGPADGLPDPVVRTILEDRDGVLWVGTAEGPLAHFDGTRFVIDPQAPRSTSALAQDHRGRLLAGTRRGFFVATQTVDGGWDWQRPAPVSGRLEGAVRVMIESPPGTVWLGTDGGGLARWRDDRLITVNVADGLPSNLVRALYPAPDGRLWIGTEDRGLARLDPDSLDSLSLEGLTQDGPSFDDDSALNVSPPVVATVDSSQGLFADSVHQILADDRGWLWMSSNRGLFRARLDDLNRVADDASQRVRTLSYTERDGMRAREANGGVQGAGIRTADGRLWFPTQDGVAVIDPGRAVIELPAPPVVIESLRTSAGLASPRDGEIVLPPIHRRFEFTFTALSFRAPERIRFRYHLSGFEDAWLDAEGRRRATYTNVPPGRYQFEVEASSDDDAWSGARASQVIVVRPFFHETTHFRVAAVLALMLATYGSSRLVSLLWLRRKLRLEVLIKERAEKLAVAMRNAPPVTLELKAIDVEPADEIFLERIRTAIEERLGDEDFGVEELATTVGYDRSHLGRKLRALVDSTPSALIRKLRLQRAEVLIAGHAGSISEIAYRVGFKSVSHFSQCFRQRYGASPTAYRRPD